MSRHTLARRLLILASEFVLYTEVWLGLANYLQVRQSAKSWRCFSYY